ncbi:MAG: PD40 domain-containing protein [Kiritimatiellales bacterium]|nr:PD40 domain-containing protein [Kiritimatiellota bacterium]MBL7012255.1 PD40 domain-containing protein [Kiritimatiellales bacterium]
MKKLIFLFLLSACCTASAQVRVAKSADRKLTINLAGLRISGPAAQQVFQTLENDLRLSGWFQPMRGGGDLQLSGSVDQNGSNVKASLQVTRAADRALLLSKGYSLEAARARTLAHRAADDIVEAITGRKGIASTKIAVIGTQSGAKEIYLCDADGGGRVQLTRDRSIVVGPNWGPDGNSLVYTSFMRGFPDVYSVNLRSGKREGLASYSGLNTGAALSPNGKELALILSKDGNPELYIQTLRGKKLTRLTSTLRATEASPTWSPDGQHLVYVSDRNGTPQLYKISRTGGRPQLISSRGTENVAPDWGPNGLITCASRSGGRYHIAIIHPSTGETRYLPNDGADYEDPSWAPDGRHLVATRSVRYRSSLYLLDTVSDAPVALISGGGDWISPAWAPQ